jgi:hypothetical protein
MHLKHLELILSVEAVLSGENPEAAIRIFSANLIRGAIRTRTAACSYFTSY